MPAVVAVAIVIIFSMGVITGIVLLVSVASRREDQGQRQEDQGQEGERGN